jgi:hypothetical protein
MAPRFASVCFLYRFRHTLHTALLLLQAHAFYLVLCFYDYTTCFLFIIILRALITELYFFLVE